MTDTRQPASLMIAAGVRRHAAGQPLPTAAVFPRLLADKPARIDTSPLTSHLRYFRVDKIATVFGSYESDVELDRRGTAATAAANGGGQVKGALAWRQDVTQGLRSEASKPSMSSVASSSALRIDRRSAPTMCWLRPARPSKVARTVSDSRASWIRWPPLGPQQPLSQFFAVLSLAPVHLIRVLVAR